MIDPIRPQDSAALGALARTATARAEVAVVRWSGEDGTTLVAAAQLHVDGRGCLLVLLAADDPVVAALAVHPVLTVEVAAPVPYAELSLEGIAHRLPVGDGAAFRLSPSKLLFSGGSPVRVPPPAYFAATPEPTWTATAGVVDRLGVVHGLAIGAFLRAHGVPVAQVAVPTALTAAGLDLAVLTADGVVALRICFPQPPRDVGRALTALGTLLGCPGCPDQDQPLPASG